jgi:2Fe-2S ferredoxin
MPAIHFILADGTRRSLDAQEGWTVMEVAREAGVPGILAECGGGALCATCHVHLEPEWLPIAGRATETEDMLLELAPGRDGASRLSCQIVLTPALDGLTLRVPEEQAS